QIEPLERPEDEFRDRTAGFGLHARLPLGTRQGRPGGARSVEAGEVGTASHDVSPGTPSRSSTVDRVAIRSIPWWRWPSLRPPVSPVPAGPAGGGSPGGIPAVRRSASGAAPRA